MKKISLTLLLVSNLSVLTFAQTAQDVKYRRSSLHTMIVETENFPKKEIVLKAFNNAPFPDKYNEHRIDKKSFNPANYPLIAEEKATLYPTSKAGSLLKSASNTKIDSVEKETPLRIQKYLDKEKIANKLVAKWFNRAADGSFDTELIIKNGAFSASFLDKKIAENSSNKDAIINAAGEELIGNTFVVINKFKYYANEPVARVIRDAAKIEAVNSIKIAPVLEKTLKGLDNVYEKTKEGYTVVATSYLYQLNWNDTTRTVFYSDYYQEKGAVDAKKKTAFDNSNLFKMKFIGSERASSFIMFSLKEKRTEDQVIEMATTRTIDAVYAKLQKEYDVFKTKTPLYTGYPITAKIGMKEGLEGGEKFEVLEQTIDPKTGVAKYEKLGTIKVDKDQIWDNRFTIGENPQAETITEVKPAIDKTTFDGGKKYYSGLLIRQLK
jgi:hypothetical protein